MEKYKHFELIVTNLSVLRYIIYSKVKLGYYDTNKKVEGFYKDLLNLTYDLELKNMNDLRKNYPGIDLGCDKTRLGIQVTSQNTHLKIDNTLVKFDKYCGHDYDRLIVFIITTKKNHSKEFESKVKFDKHKDIIDIDDLLSEIEMKDTSEIERISDFIKAEIPYYIVKITNEKDILGNREDYKHIKPRNFEKFKETYQGDEDSYNEDFSEFKNNCLELHKNLLSISKRQRSGLLVFLTKCDLQEMEMNIQTWGNILEDSFGFNHNEIASMLNVMENKNILFNDEGEPPNISISNIIFWQTLVEILGRENDLHDFIINVNFSLIDG